MIKAPNGDIYGSCGDYVYHALLVDLAKCHPQNKKKYQRPQDEVWKKKYRNIDHRSNFRDLRVEVV